MNAIKHCLGICLLLSCSCSLILYGKRDKTAIENYLGSRWLVGIDYKASRLDDRVWFRIYNDIACQLVDLEIQPNGYITSIEEHLGLRHPANTENPGPKRDPEKDQMFTYLETFFACSGDVNKFPESVWKALNGWVEERHALGELKDLGMEVRSTWDGISVQLKWPGQKAPYRDFYFSSVPIELGQESDCDLHRKGFELLEEMAKSQNDVGSPSFYLIISNMEEFRIGAEPIDRKRIRMDADLVLKGMENPLPNLHFQVELRPRFDVRQELFFVGDLEQKGEYSHIIARIRAVRKEPPGPDEIARVYDALTRHSKRD